jgi:L-fucose isomerase-like protein
VRVLSLRQLGEGLSSRHPHWNRADSRHVLGEANTVGALAGRTAAGPVTFGRVSTDDLTGKIKAYVGQGQFTDDPLDTFGTKAVVKIPLCRA